MLLQSLALQFGIFSWKYLSRDIIQSTEKELGLQYGLIPDTPEAEGGKALVQGHHGKLGKTLLKI